jgi:secreted trypsin-like serine protease
LVVLYVPESPCQCGIANEDYLDHENPIAEVLNTKNDEVDSKIINGYETKPNEYPWQVALVKSGRHTPFCGGSIISDKHVLTAAHCTADLDFVGKYSCIKITTT